MRVNAPLWDNLWSLQCSRATHQVPWRNHLQSTTFTKQLHSTKFYEGRGWLTIKSSAWVEAHRLCNTVMNSPPMFPDIWISKEPLITVHPLNLRTLSKSSTVWPGQTSNKNWPWKLHSEKLLQFTFRARSRTGNTSVIVILICHPVCRAFRNAKAFVRFEFFATIFPWLGIIAALFFQYTTSFVKLKKMT